MENNTHLKNIFRDWCGLLSINEIMTNHELIELIRKIEMQLLTGKDNYEPTITRQH